MGGFFLLFLSFCLPIVCQADQANYVYDELGRLYRVIDGSGNVATYHGGTGPGTGNGVGPS
ncbi:MAG TPA: hypothetical protein VGB26_14290 [Nitrospiria bacterium]